MRDKRCMKWIIWCKNMNKQRRMKIMCYDNLQIVDDMIWIYRL